MNGVLGQCIWLLAAVVAVRPGDQQPGEGADGNGPARRAAMFVPALASHYLNRTTSGSRPVGVLGASTNPLPVFSRAVMW